jgi:DNA-binding transcriptional LysR family regulator
MGRITIAQIEAFYWVAELGSVHKAASKLNVTQPTVSLRLRQLEAELASPVLEHHGRGVRVTEAGHAFLDKARLVLDAYAQMRSHSAQKSIAGVLRIGLAEGFSVACLPHLVSALARHYPSLRPEWTVTTSAVLEQNLVDGDLDLAVLVDAMGHRSLRLSPLGLQPNVWASSSAFAIAAGASPREVARFTVITTPPPTAMYRSTFAWFAEAGRKPDALCICTSVNAAAQLVDAGIGVGIFPSRMVETYGATGRMVALITDPPLSVGRVTIADRVAADHERTEPVTRVIEDVTRTMGYFDAVS